MAARLTVSDGSGNRAPACRIDGYFFRPQRALLCFWQRWIEVNNFIRWPRWPDKGHRYKCARVAVALHGKTVPGWSLYLGSNLISHDANVVMLENF
jgi:hypothetical protein